MTDHLGSAQVTAAEGGAASGVQRYTAFGEVRSRGGEMPTAYQYTGQLSQMEQVGLYHYGARWFDPAGAHFTQADTLVPGVGNPLSWDRYAYVNYNPIIYTDPTGHMQACADGDIGGGCGSASTVDTYAGAINDWFDNVSLGMGNWNANDLATVIQSLFAASSLHGGTGEFAEDVGEFSVLKFPEKILGVSTERII
ncbi:RHS repeat-associated core domain-containing protein [Levilinea saccharolytica]|uniref:RHS repeat-associated core domain-containing protein n=1 Tax=Levilinea saccharolytica TaxID=229921 RepID=UPI0007829AC3|nr:RHS repeat-associated core domain-containing protein [Levilinea saccharolytica]GAP18555.1 protein containing RHS repeat-associated core domain [Levilinea saccharolytica]